MAGTVFGLWAGENLVHLKPILGLLLGMTPIMLSVAAACFNRGKIFNREIFRAVCRHLESIG